MSLRFRNANPRFGPTVFQAVFAIAFATRSLKRRSIPTSEEPLIGAVDVDYRVNKAVAACVLFRGWFAGVAMTESVVTVDRVEPYEPGQFYRRELPCLLAALATCTVKPAIVIVDSYVWLGAEDRPGLGAYLHEALGKQTVVVGVAKTRFQSAAAAVPICRGTSHSPLYITAAGITNAEAAKLVQGMHGPFRIPTLLKRADHLCRNSPESSAEIPVTTTDSATTPPNPEATWTVHRQDDNGNRFIVEKHLTRADAERLAATLEARGHKQLYWTEPDVGG